MGGEGDVLWSGVEVATYHSSLKCASKSDGQASGFFFGALTGR